LCSEDFVRVVSSIVVAMSLPARALSESVSLKALFLLFAID
jgi:hypothetical protein